MTEPFTVFNLDVAEIAMWLFTGFFFGLVLYLRREDRRDGYPLETDVGGRLEPNGGLLFNAEPKTFRLAHGAGTVQVPSKKRDPKLANATRTAPWPGAPIEPVGDPLAAGVGPGAYAQRADVPDRMWSGEVKIVPLRAAPDFSIAKGDPKLIGYAVFGADGREAGRVTDVWVDRSELLIRYLEVKLPSGRVVLAPMTMAVVKAFKNAVTVSAITSRQFENAPATAKPDEITFLEEEKIVGYFGAGYLYATPDRKEPLL
jgi:photosynthetic reaction center H subunit